LLLGDEYKCNIEAEKIKCNFHKKKCLGIYNMKPFIEHLSEILIAQIEKGNDPILILPNKRPIAYLQKYMASKAQQAIWFPKIYTIEEFVIHITQMQVADPIYTAASLFEIYSEALQDQADSFDDFIKWWNLIISDFNDIDMYMVDAMQLFNYINDAKAIELWNPGEHTPTPLQQHYLSFWKYLPTFYHQLNQVLVDQNLGYRGMLYKKAAHILQNNAFTLTNTPVIFAGFNALSTSEEIIVEHFLKNNQGFIYCESDDYYLRDSQQEAGKFLRKYKAKWEHYPNAIFYTNNCLLSASKEVNIIGAPKSMMQATVAGNLTSKILLNNVQNAALIPADEAMLLPLLYHLPEKDIKEINISMGYPIVSLPLSSLYAIIFELISKLEKEKDALFNTHLIHQLFSHPYSNILFTLNKNQNVQFEIKNLIQKIVASNKIYFSIADIKVLNDENPQLNFYYFFELLIQLFNNEITLTQLLNSINTLLEENANQLGELKEILLLQITTYNEILKDIFHVFYNSNKNIITQHKTVLNLINQSLASKTLPFIGNATGGFQFIGILETRMLHFDEVIICGCNEGILPSAKASGNSFIPYDIRNQYQLPTYKDSEAIFAYHFYRLIQGAKKVHLIYNTETDEFGSGEKSRFLTQLEMELVIKNPLANINSKIISLPNLTHVNRNSISFEHNSKIDNAISDLLEKGLSATALISYKNCPLQFYFKYIEKVKEPNEIANEVGANIVGSVIHAVLEEIYAPLKNDIIKLNQIEYNIADLEAKTIKAFKHIEPNAEIQSGKNLLFIQTAVRIVFNYLKEEQKALKRGANLKLLFTEQQFDGNLNINNATIKLRGTIDRMDLYNNQVRIIDYKTGSVDTAKLKIKNLDDLFLDADYDKAFQLLFYTLLYIKNFPEANKDVLSGILSLRKISIGLSCVEAENKDELMSLFEDKLVDLIKNLMKQDVPFKQTNNLKICSYCAYVNVCMK
jgi:RecB family exonuclease